MPASSNWPPWCCWHLRWGSGRKRKKGLLSLECLCSLRECGLCRCSISQKSQTDSQTGRQGRFGFGPFLSFFFFFLAHAILHFAPHRSMLHACASSVGTAWVCYFRHAPAAPPVFGRMHELRARSLESGPMQSSEHPRPLQPPNPALSFTHTPKASLVYPT